MKNFRLILLPLVLSVAACGPAPSDETPPVTNASDASAAAPVTPQVVVAPTKMIHAEPAALTSCKPAQVVLSWDLRKEKPELKTVKIYTGNGKLFTHSGGVGSQETGPWVKPGSEFILKSAVDDAELERLTIGGPVCP